MACLLPPTSSAMKRELQHLRHKTQPLMAGTPLLQPAPSVPHEPYESSTAPAPGLPVHLPQLLSRPCVGQGWLQARHEPARCGGGKRDSVQQFQCPTAVNSAKTRKVRSRRPWAVQLQTGEDDLACQAIYSCGEGCTAAAAGKIPPKLQIRGCAVSPPGSRAW